ncbi:hypothetical protein [Tangfeifania diversioriginum]|nr:hypothetical protein [Tangfeifania diversioriginum]
MKLSKAQAGHSQTLYGEGKKQVGRLPEPLLRGMPKLLNERKEERKTGVRRLQAMANAKDTIQQLN